MGNKMKIAVIGDTHLGYSRFYEDSFSQARAAFKDADKKSDIILFLGDLYDSRVPTLQVLGEAISLFRSISTKVYAIHGNHERRSRGTLNPVELLEKAGLLTHLHLKGETFEKNKEEIFIAGLQIPKWAYVGIGTVYTNAFADLPQICGTPYCPEISTTFMITKQ